MAQKTALNPIANFYEAQTIATAEIAQAALDGMQRLQKTYSASNARQCGGPLSLAQSWNIRDGDSPPLRYRGGRPAAEQGARYQREMVQAIADMNNDIVRASYSMMERMRDALGARHRALTMSSALPG